MRTPRRRLLTRWLLRLALVGLLVGPWPLDSTPFTSQSAFRDTVERLRTLSVASQRGPFRVGVAQAALTEVAPLPLAGFVDQITQPHEGADSPCLVRALTIAPARGAVTIVAVDLLLINDDLRRAVLARTGLGPDEVYFTATHTHSAPGGWGNHPLERLVAGTYDPEQCANLATTIATTIAQSRSRLEPAEVAFVQADCPGMQVNRVLPRQPTNDLISAWVFRGRRRGEQSPRAIATLAVFGAHATISHPRPPRLGGDYPAAFAEALGRLADPGVVLFAAGTVGDASPVRPAAPNQRRSVQAYGEALAQILARAIASARFDAGIDLANLDLAVDLPPVQVPFFTASLRLSPAATWWVGSRRTHLRLLRLGPATLVGFPGDIAGHLARTLTDPGPLVVTSFNGDYKGYLVPRSTFESTFCYETRALSLYGPDLGDLLVNLAQRALDRLRIPGVNPR